MCFKGINEILTLGKGFGYLIGAICIAGIMYKGVLASQLKRVNQKGSDNYIPTAIFLTKKIIEEKVYNGEIENEKIEELLKICEKININSILEHTPTLS